VQIAGKSGVMRDIPSNVTYGISFPHPFKVIAVGGCPAVPIAEWHRQTIVLRKMLQDFREKKQVS
jgi:UDP-3-O-[3-hydroxymyristoyl] glucosamine N-acyltransferase